MVEPVTILAGVALAKKCFDALSKASETANDISEISHFVAEIFKTKKEIDENVIKQKDNTDLSVAMASVIEQKQIDIVVEKTRKLVNQKYGQNTWNEILDVQSAAIEEQKKQEKQIYHDKVVEKVKIRHASLPSKEEQQYDRLYKILIETCKFSALIIIAFAVFYAIWSNRCTEGFC